MRSWKTRAHAATHVADAGYSVGDIYRFFLGFSFLLFCGLRWPVWFRRENVEGRLGKPYGRPRPVR